MDKALVRIVVWYVNRLPVSRRVPTIDKLFRGLGLSRSQARRAISELGTVRQMPEWRK